MKPGGSAIRDSLPTRARIRPVLIEILCARGETSVADLDAAIADYFALTEVQRSLPHSGTRTELAYRCAWVRTAGKRDGWLVQPEARVWALAAQKG